MDKILVPLDGSELAEQVLPLVAEMSSKLGREVVLLQATTGSGQALSETVPNTTGLGSPEVSVDIASRRVEAEAGAAERYLASVKARLEGQGLSVTVAVGEGPPAEVIVDYAGSSEVSLIALASHGRGGLQRAIFGSVADAVLRNSPVPVLLVRAKT